eukprot:jgi/Botrbrau1/16245/Bobra.0066s0030.1
MVGCRCGLVSPMAPLKFCSVCRALGCVLQLLAIKCHQHPYVSVDKWLGLGDRGVRTAPLPSMKAWDSGTGVVAPPQPKGGGKKCVPA